MKIVEKIGRPAVLEQLGEEAAELAHAALKLARCMRGENPTPRSRRQCEKELREELTDVILCLRILELKADKELMKYKQNRWEKRLKEREQR